MDQFMDCGPNCRELGQHTRAGRCILAPLAPLPEVKHHPAAKLYADTLNSVSGMMAHLETAFPGDGEGDYYAEGELRLWHKDGWSPGYFYQNELGWVFHPSYLES